MNRRIRLLPVIIFSATLALTLKVGVILYGPGIGVSPAAAESAPPKEQPAQAAGKTAAPHAAGKSKDTHAAGKSGSAKAKGDGVGDEFDPSSVTQAEFEILQRLAKRRTEIDKLRNDVALRENLLDATEKRLNAKMAELTKLKTLIEGLLKKHDEEQEAKIKSLVKIYETMKAKNAARIFERLEIDVLLDVVEKMREAKTALILAAMDPSKAKELTSRLAERRQLPQPTLPGESG